MSMDPVILILVVFRVSKSKHEQKAVGSQISICHEVQNAGNLPSHFDLIIAMTTVNLVTCKTNKSCEGAFSFSS